MQDEKPKYDGLGFECTSAAVLLLGHRRWDNDLDDKVRMHFDLVSRRTLRCASVSLRADVHRPADSSQIFSDGLIPVSELSHAILCSYMEEWCNRKATASGGARHGINGIEASRSPPTAGPSA
jgi:hypothetical protein